MWPSVWRDVIRMVRARPLSNFVKPTRHLGFGFEERPRFEGQRKKKNEMCINTEHKSCFVLSRHTGVAEILPDDATAEPGGKNHAGHV